MKKITFIISMILASLLRVGSVSAVQLWTGAGKNNKINVAENWDSGTVPQSGDALLFTRGDTYENDLAAFSPSALTYSNTTSLGIITFTGNPLTVGDSGLNCLFEDRGREISFNNGFSGSGTVRAENHTENLPCSLDLPPSLAGKFTFAGKWIFDRVILSAGVPISSIGSDEPGRVIPDSVVLKNGGSIKNYLNALVIDERMGIVLGEGGGGFACGWKANGNFSIQVNGPVSGDGPLLIATCYCPIFLNNTNNSFTGETFVGTDKNIASFAIKESDETCLSMGCDYAIPRGNDVTVDGKSRAVLELNGHSLELGRLSLVRGGILRNSSATPATVKVGTLVFGGRIEGPVNLVYEHKELSGSRDDLVWDSGTYLTLTNGERSVLSEMGLGGTALRLDGGTLVLPVRDGFAESAYAGFLYRNDEKSITAFKPNAAMGNVENSANWPVNSGYYYQAQWYIPESLPYSFCKHFDDAAALEIDRELVIENKIPNAVVQKKDYFLEKGWHEVRIWFSNAGEEATPRDWENGLKWSSDNVEITAGTGNAFSTGYGRFIFSPALIRPLYTGPKGGTVERRNDGMTGSMPDLLLLGGLISTEKTSSAAPLRVDGGVTVGYRGNVVPVFDGDLDLPEGKVLTFRDRVWIRRIPTCPYTIIPGTEVFLDPEIYEAMRERVVAAQGVICWAPFNLPVSPTEDPIRVTGNQILCLSDGFLGDTPLWDGTVEQACRNGFDLAEGSTLTVRTGGPAFMDGAISGSGTLKISGWENGTPNLGLRGDSQLFCGSLELEGNGGIVTAARSSNLGSNAVVRIGTGYTLVLGETDCPLTRYPQKFEMAGGTFDLRSEKVAVEALRFPAGSQPITLNGNTLSVKSTGADFPEEVTINGTGSLEIESVGDTVYPAPAFTGNGRILFTGSGSVDVRALAASFSGSVTVGDKVRLYTGIPTDPVLWLDASDRDSLTSDGLGGVSKWNDCREEKEGNLYPYAYLNKDVPNDRGTGYKIANAPLLLDDKSLKTGPVLDFGKTNSGRWFSLTTRTNTPISMQTVIFVIGSQNGGGISFFSYSNPENGGIVRGGGVPGTSISAPMYSSESHSNPLFRNALVRKNGEKSSPNSGLSGGYEIITTRISEGQLLDALAKDSRHLSGGDGDGAKRTGGMRYAELLFYDRQLSPSEIIAVETYLKDKWMNNVFFHKGDSVSDPIPLKVEGRVEVDLDDPGAVGDIPAVSGNGTLVSKGPGTLRISRTDPFGGTIDWQGGQLILGEDLPVPAFWCDMAKIDSFGTDENGRFYWRDRRWDGVTDYLCATQRWSTAPTVIENELGGLPILDFGAISTTEDRGLQWSRTVSARVVFMVIGSQNGGGMILGGNGSSRPYGRGSSPTLALPLVSPLYSSQAVREGAFRLDGKNVDGRYTRFSGGYQILMSNPTAPVEVGQFAHDPSPNRSGGQRLGEVLIFTNGLSSAQIRRVEKYLTDKWMGGSGNRLGGYDAVHEVSATGGPLSLVKGGSGQVDVLTGSADIEKGGNGCLEIGDASSYTGTVAVLSGSLSLNSPASRILKRAAFWVDAAKRESMTFAPGGNEVVQWRDCRDNGIYARRAAGKTSNVNGTVYPNLNPVMLEDELNGLPVMDFGEWMGNRFMVWSRPLHGIRTVFWVIGSQNGGGILLGYSGDGDIRDFYREGGGEDFMSLSIIEARNPIWASRCARPCMEIINGKTRLNGRSVGDPTGLGGGYDIVSLRTTGPVRASAFSMDRDRKYRNATGGQRLAEVIIFNEKLTDGETDIVEAYLASKWGLPLENRDHVEKLHSESGLSVQLTRGTGFTLYPAGVPYRLGSVGGIGRVTGGEWLKLRGLGQVSATRADDALDFSGSVSLVSGGEWTVSLEGAEAAPVRVAGRFSLADQGHVTLTDAGAVGDGPMLLLSARELDAPSVDNWKVASDDPARYFKLSREGNALYLVPYDKGIILILK